MVNVLSEFLIIIRKLVLAEAEYTRVTMNWNMSMNLLQRLWQCVTVGVHLGREVLQIVHGVYQISKLPGPCISIFGGSRLEQNNKYAQQASKLADMLAEKGITVLTGGGPGIMEAANCGAAHHRGPYPLRSLSFGMRGLTWETQSQKCEGDSLLFDYFFARKWLLINYSRAFCVFPGGLGTIDELSDVRNLMITQKLPHFPVVLIGVEFWQPYEAWLKDSRALGLIPASMEPPILITDNLDDAFNTLMKYASQEC